MPSPTPNDPAPKPPGRSGPPPGEGWDDGRGHRSGGGEEGTPRGRGRARRPAGGTTAAGGGSGAGRSGGLAGLLGGLPRWGLPAIAAGVVLLLVLLVVVVGGGGGGRSDAGACLTDLSEHLPESAVFVSGSDLVRARSVGYEDDGDLEELGSTQRETGVVPDALSQQLRFGRLLSTEDFTARTGVEPGQIDCSLSDGPRSILSGGFDAAEVNGSAVADDGSLAASEDRLAYALGDVDPTKLLEPRDGGGLGSTDDVTRVLETLRDGESYSVAIQVGNPDAEKRARAAGVGVADGDGDERTLVVAWAYADDDAAKAGRRDVVDRINDTFEGTVSISADDLTVDGSLVTATIDAREAPDLIAATGRGLELIDRD